LDLAWFLVCLGGAFAALVVYYYVGGPGGVLGALASHRALQQSRAVFPEPAPAPSHGSMASAPPRSAGAGFSRPAALKQIDQTFSNDLTPFTIRMNDLGEFVSPGSLERLSAAFIEQVTPAQVPEDDEEPLTDWVKQNERDFLRRAAVGALGGASMTRTLREFSESERNALRLAHVMEALGALSPRERLMITVPLVWNDGDCALTPGGSAFFAADRRAKLRDALNDIIVAHFGKKGASFERVESALRSALARDSMVTRDDRAVLERYLFSGTRWLSPEDDYSNLEPNGDSPTALRFGPFYGTQSEMYYDSRQSIFTIAAPGTGKSLMLKRNLLSYRGGAVVLDVKGELYEATAGWRKRNVGPVYRYNPSDPSNSISFNPLDWVRTDDFGYEDATVLARALSFPPDKEDYWDKAALRTLAVAIAKTCHSPGRAGRTVFDAVAAINDIGVSRSANEGDSFDAIQRESTPEVQAWIKALYESGQPLLYEEGRTILSMPAKQRAGVLEVARTQLMSWLANNVFQISQETRLRGEDLRWTPEGPATLYISVDLDRIDYYRSTIRALLACLFRDLTRGSPSRTVPAVTFFLDEMPRLKRMDILETGLATGRGYGVRFWMFAQTMSQLDEIYKEAAPGMVEMCAARIYMNPTEERAQIMSRHISEREGLLEGRRKPLVDPAELYGPEFRDSIVVMSQGNYPARLHKLRPDDDPLTFKSRLDLPVT